MPDAIGWASSLILLTTIVAQIHKQWRERSGEGVSIWLFVGQTAASLGFAVYSVMLGNWVFSVTNALMAASAVLGWVLTARFRREGASRSPAPRPAPSSHPDSRAYPGAW